MMAPGKGAPPLKQLWPYFMVMFDFWVFSPIIYTPFCLNFHCKMRGRVLSKMARDVSAQLHQVNVEGDNYIYIGIVLIHQFQDPLIFTEIRISYISWFMSAKGF